MVTPSSASPLLDRDQGLRSGYASEASPRRLLAQFVVRICLGGTSETSHISEWRKRRHKAPLKWLPVQPIRSALLIANGSPHTEAAILKNLISQLSANQNWSFNCKWRLPIEAELRSEWGGNEHFSATPRRRTLNAAQHQLHQIYNIYG